MSTLRGRAYIAGIGQTKVGKVPEKSSLMLYAESVKAAAVDAGLALHDIDGLITANSRGEPYLYHAEMVAEYLGIKPSYCLTVGTGGSTTGTLIHQSAALLEAGVCHNMVIAKADNLATGMGRQATIESMATIGHPEFEAHTGPLIPALYALFATRYMHEYHVTAEELAQVAVVDRYHASLNPSAQYRQLITVEDVLDSRMITDPLHLLECAPVSDAGCAIVMRSTDRVADSGHKPVFLLGAGDFHDFEHVSQATSYARTGAKVSGRAAYEMAGVHPSDVDVAMIYDAFGFIQCMQLEDLGFCEEGEGGAFVADGQTRLGGSLPTNTHGGVLSHSHAGKPSALFLVLEAVEQLRSACGERQVEGATIALVHTEGGIIASHSTLILGTELS
jgi:acetyl-CoA acetyltransferase